MNRPDPLQLPETAGDASPRLVELVCKVLGHKPKPFVGRSMRGRLLQGTARQRCGRILQATRRLPRSTRRRIRFGRG